MNAQLIASGSQSPLLTPFEEAALRAFKFGLALDSCQQLKAFLDASEDGNDSESSLLEKIYITEMINLIEVDYN